MNKRILELKDQCYIPIADRYSDTEYDMDKFAELIIDECSQVCLSRAAQNYNFHLIADEAIFCSIRIKQHFGIEGRIELKANFGVE